MPSSIKRLALALVVAAMAFFAVPAYAAPTDLNLNVTLSGGMLHVTGTVVSNDTPVANATLEVYIDSTLTGSGTTDASGACDFYVNVSHLTPGEYRTEIRFAGQGTAEAEDWSAQLPVTEVPVTGDPSTLTVSGPEEGVAGAVIDLTGTLHNAAGAAVANAGIAVSYQGQDVRDSYTVTGADGTFTTYFEIPTTHTDPTLTLTLTFAGAREFGAASATFEMPVTPASGGGGDEASASTEASPSDSASASASPEASPSASPSASESATPADGASGAPIALIAFAVAGVGVVVLGVAFAVYLRNKRGELPARGAEDDGPDTGSWLIGDGTTETRVAPVDLPEEGAAPSTSLEEAKTVLVPAKPEPGDDRLFGPDSLEETSPLPKVSEPVRPSRAAPPDDADYRDAAAPQHGDFDPPAPRPRRGM